MYPENYLHIFDVFELLDDCRSAGDVQYVFFSAIRQADFYAWPPHWKDLLRVECALRIKDIEEAGE